MNPVRHLIQQQIREMVGAPRGGPPPDPPRADLGLFGPQAACWRVHGDLTTMLVGGVAALLLQMLHPAALAGVWDHSNFREDMRGRLRRTAMFITGTTYGSVEEAEALIAKVRGIHDRVGGILPDGQPYSANDPQVLTWVQAAGAASFLTSYLRHSDPTFARADQDRYFAETAIIAEKLGATEVPKTKAATLAYLQALRPQLRCDARTREVTGVILARRGAWASPVAGLIFQAAQDLLPDWAAQMHGFHRPPSWRPAIRLGVAGLGATLRWALPDGPETRARRRAQTA